MSGVYYNEIDPFCAQWLRNLVAAGHLPAGDVDDRSIVDVSPDDLRGYHACHFFAGLGGWPYALGLAGWPADREAWTGSCPCQPLSSAGQRKGHADERHLWPAFQRLIAERRPATVFGEQVASADGREWLAGVRLDLEAMGYACGAADLCAAGVGAPHIRQRLYWVANADRERRDWQPVRAVEWARDPEATRRSSVDRMADAESERSRPFRHAETIVGWRKEQFARSDLDAQGLGDTASTGPQGERREHRESGIRNLRQSVSAMPARFGQWNGSSISVQCSDGARRIPAEPAFFPLVDGSAPGRVGILRASGNAIVPQVAAQFVTAFLGAEEDMRGAA